MKVRVVFSTALFFLLSFLSQARADDCLSVSDPISFSAKNAYLDSASLVAGKIPNKLNGVTAHAGGLITIAASMPANSDGTTTFHQSSLDMELELTTSLDPKSSGSSHKKFRRIDLSGSITILPEGIKRISMLGVGRNNPNPLSFWDKAVAQKACITGIAIDASLNKSQIYGATVYIYFNSTDTAVELYSVRSTDDRDSKAAASLLEAPVFSTQSVSSDGARR